MQLRVPGSGDDRQRAVCEACGNICYSNPKVVVACVILLVNDNDDDNELDHRCLLGKRSIEPRAGYWGYPQGFLEDGETSRQAAVREAYEEMGIKLDPSALRLRGVYNVPGSVQLVYEARVSVRDDGEDVELFAKSTQECSEIAVFERSSLPELCFPTVQWALDRCWSDEKDKVQQKTKAYDSDTDRWSEEEDEAILSS
jgi:ADP-ribose pyrophosphatase YjhB (NUDIX family)